MTQAPEGPQERCCCPEVRLTDDERVVLGPDYAKDIRLDLRDARGALAWVPFCEYREYFTGPGWLKLPADSASPDPVNWRCPRYKGSIIRTGVTPVTSQDMDELQAVDDYFGVDASVSPDLTPVDQYFRIYYRCSSQSCGWNNFVVTWPGEGLVAGAQVDGQHE